MVRFVRAFYNYPQTIQWFLSVIIALIVVWTSSLLLFDVFFPLNILMIPLIKTAGHFSITPLLRLSGILNYHSPLLLTVKYNDSYWEIHNGTTFDYVKNMTWSERGGKARQKTIQNYFSGLLSLISEIKKNKNPKNINVAGTSYFIGRNTINKIGFKEENGISCLISLKIIVFFLLITSR